MRRPARRRPAGMHRSAVPAGVVGGGDGEGDGPQRGRGEGAAAPRGAQARRSFCHRCVSCVRTDGKSPGGGRNPPRRLVQQTRSWIRFQEQHGARCGQRTGSSRHRARPHRRVGPGATDPADRADGRGALRASATGSWPACRSYPTSRPTTAHHTVPRARSAAPGRTARARRGPRGPENRSDSDRPDRSGPPARQPARAVSGRAAGSRWPRWPCSRSSDRSWG